MKRKNILCLYLIILLLGGGCSNPTERTSKGNITQAKESRDSTIIHKIKKYKPTNASGSSFWGDTTGRFDVTRFSDLLRNDSIEKAALYLKTNRPPEMDSINLNVYKSNLSNVLIRQGKFELVAELLSEVIDTEANLSTISERLLRSEAYVQMGRVDDAIRDLNFVIEKGGRSRWGAYREKGILRYNILKDTIGGCEDLKKGVSNDYTQKIYKKYCG
ncbi:MAG: hypothetical protein ACRBFS_10235 [Aureispira sp.]